MKESVTVMKTLKKILMTLMTLTLVTTMTCTAFAATPDPTEPYEPLPEPEFSGEVENQTGIIGMPMGDGTTRVRSWVAEQIRIKPVYTNADLEGELYVSLRLADATKIIFIANEVCPVEYDRHGNLWVSNINVPCGISLQRYRFLDLASRLAAEYGEGGVETLMDLYTADELSEIYDELSELAMPYYGELVTWLDDFRVGAMVPTFMPSMETEPTVMPPITPDDVPSSTEG